MQLPNLKMILIILLFFIETSGAQTPETSFESEIIPIQQQFIAQLTGHSFINGSKKLANRSSHAERTVAANFLYDALMKFGLRVEKHEYKLANVNIFVDPLFDPFGGSM